MVFTMAEYLYMCLFIGDQNLIYYFLEFNLNEYDVVVP